MMAEAEAEAEAEAKQTQDLLEEGSAKDRLIDGGYMPVIMLGALAAISYLGSVLLLGLWVIPTVMFLRGALFHYYPEWSHKNLTPLDKFLYPALAVAFAIMAAVLLPALLLYAAPLAVETVAFYAANDH